MALAGTDTSSLLEILEGTFGHFDHNITTLSISTETPAQKPTTTEKPSEEALEKVPVAPPGESSLASTELVFPLKSIPLVIAGLPKSLLPLCGPETLSQYRCQYSSCNYEFSQNVATYNHVLHDHLNVALACLYCSFNSSPKMHWYSASAWEHHTHKHVQNNLPIYPDDPRFSSLPSLRLSHQPPQLLQNSPILISFINKL